MSSLSFSKQERLCSRKAILELFQKADSHHKFVHPFLIRWKFEVETAPYPAKIVFSVSKKRFKKAHDRNRIKRLLREAYRLTKNELYQVLDNQKVCNILIIYTFETETDLLKLQQSFLKAYKSILFTQHENHPDRID